jgi:transposase
MAEKHACSWRRSAERRAEQLRAQEAKLEAQRVELVDKQVEVDLLAAKVSELERKLALATKQIVGPKSERMPTPDEEAKKREGPSAKRGGNINPAKRKENAAKKAALPAVVIPRPVADEDRRCPHCGEDAKPIGEGDVSVEWEWIPGYFQKRLYVVEAARCPCKQHYARGPAPLRVQEGCQYGPGFIAKLVVDRCADATPIYRMEKAMQRAGIPMARSTMGDLVHLAATVCEPLWEAAFAELRVDPYVQADETSFRTQTRPERSFLWTFLSKLYTLYTYSPSRSGDTPKEVLGGTTGTLTVDGYTGYNIVTDVEGRERTGCFSHARRKLFEAMPTAPEARVALDIILELFMVERKAKSRGILGTAEHLRLRRSRSVDALGRLLGWMKDTIPLYEPKSAMGEALRYMQNQWFRLTAFTDDPQIPIHNNASEAALRIIALARKNSLFFGNDAAGKRFAMLYSLVATCEKHDVNPVEYFTDVLIRIHDHPKARIGELLPHRWKATFGRGADPIAPDTPDEATAP